MESLKCDIANQAPDFQHGRKNYCMGDLKCLCSVNGADRVV